MVAQDPVIPIAQPQMRRTEAVGQVVKMGAVHHRLLEHLGNTGEFASRQGQIAENLIGKAVRELAVELVDQGHALIAGDVLGTDFLRRIIGCPADDELDEGSVVVKIVDSVIDGVVLAVGAGSTLGAGLKAAVLDRIVIGALRVPFQVLAKVMHLDALFLDLGSVGGHIGLQLHLFDAKVVAQISQRGAAQIDL